MLSREFSKFKAVYDNIQQTVSASDIQEIQQAVNRNEKSDFVLVDTMRKMLGLVLFDSLSYNSMWYEGIMDSDNIDFGRGNNEIIFDEDELVLKLKDDSISTNGIVYTLYNNLNLDGTNTFLFWPDDYIPDNSNIIYEVSNNNSDFYVITGGTEIVVPSNGTGITIKITMTRVNRTIASPKVKSMILYHNNEAIEALLNLSEGVV